MICSRTQVGEAIGELVACHHPGWGKPAVRERVASLLTMVGLDPGRAGADQEPPLREMAPGHMAACFFPAS